MGSIAIPLTPPSTEKGEPATGESAPVPALMLKAEMSPETVFARYRKLPVGLPFTAREADPVLYGEPEIADRTPDVWSEESAETLEGLPAALAV